MIITLTGKPCSGKGTVGRLFASTYNFEFISTGDMFRSVSKQFGVDNILDFNHDARIRQIDKEIDNQTKLLGEIRLNDNILIDSRMAWHFIPHSFKVFLDVDINTASKRLLNANRESEQVKNLTQAKKVLLDRWNTENIRYQELYQTDNTNPNNYDLVVSTDNKSVEDIVEEIYNKYNLFIKK